MTKPTYFGSMSGMRTMIILATVAFVAMRLMLRSIVHILRTSGPRTNSFLDRRDGDYQVCSVARTRLRLAVFNRDEVLR